MSSFHVDGRVSIKLEYDLAMRLGEFILSSGTEDKQFLALGHKLLNLDEDDSSNIVSPRRKDYFHEKEVIRSAGRILKDVPQNPVDTDESWEKAEVTKTPIRIRSKYSKNY